MAFDHSTHDFFEILDAPAEVGMTDMDRLALFIGRRVLALVPMALALLLFLIAWWFVLHRRTCSLRLWLQEWTSPVVRTHLVVPQWVMDAELQKQKRMLLDEKLEAVQKEKDAHEMEKRDQQTQHRRETKKMEKKMKRYEEMILSRDTGCQSEMVALGIKKNQEHNAKVIAGLVLELNRYKDQAERGQHQTCSECKAREAECKELRSQALENVHLKAEGMQLRHDVELADLKAVRAACMASKTAQFYSAKNYHMRQSTTKSIRRMLNGEYKEKMKKKVEEIRRILQEKYAQRRNHRPEEDVPKPRKNDGNDDDDEDDDQNNDDRDGGKGAVLDSRPLQGDPPVEEGSSSSENTQQDDESQNPDNNPVQQAASSSEDEQPGDDNRITDNNQPPANEHVADGDRTMEETDENVENKDTTEEESKSSAADSASFASFPPQPQAPIPYSPTCLEIAPLHGSALSPVPQNKNTNMLSTGCTQNPTSVPDEAQITDINMEVEIEQPATHSADTRNQDKEMEAITTGENIGRAADDMAVDEPKVSAREICPPAPASPFSSVAENSVAAALQWAARLAATLPPRMSPSHTMVVAGSVYPPAPYTMASTSTLARAAPMAPTSSATTPPSAPLYDPLRMMNGAPPIGLFAGRPTLHHSATPLNTPSSMPQPRVPWLGPTGFGVSPHNTMGSRSAPGAPSPGQVGLPAAQGVRPDLHRFATPLNTPSTWPRPEVPWLGSTEHAPPVNTGISRPSLVAPSLGQRGPGYSAPPAVIPSLTQPARGLSTSGDPGSLGSEREAPMAAAGPQDEAMSRSNTGELGTGSSVPKASTGSPPVGMLTSRNTAGGRGNGGGLREGSTLAHSAEDSAPSAIVTQTLRAVHPTNGAGNPYPTAAQAVPQTRNNPAAGAFSGGQTGAGNDATRKPLAEDEMMRLKQKKKDENAVFGINRNRRARRRPEKEKAPPGPKRSEPPPNLIRLTEDLQETMKYGAPIPASNPAPKRAREEIMAASDSKRQRSGVGNSEVDISASTGHVPAAIPITANLESSGVSTTSKASSKRLREEDDEEDDEAENVKRPRAESTDAEAVTLTPTVDESTIFNNQDAVLPMPSNEDLYDDPSDDDAKVPGQH